MVFQAQTLSLQKENTTYGALRSGHKPRWTTFHYEQSFHSMLHSWGHNHQMPTGYSPDLVTIQMPTGYMPQHSKSNLEEKCRSRGIPIQPCSCVQSPVQRIINTAPIPDNATCSRHSGPAGHLHGSHFVLIPHRITTKYKRLRWHTSRSKEIPACDFLSFCVPLALPFSLR